jgi:hypothetical protein
LVPVEVDMHGAMPPQSPVSVHVKSSQPEEPDDPDDDPDEPEDEPDDPEEPDEEPDDPEEPDEEPDDPDDPEELPPLPELLDVLESELEHAITIAAAETTETKEEARVSAFMRGEGTDRRPEVTRKKNAAVPAWTGPPVSVLAEQARGLRASG